MVTVNERSINADIDNRFRLLTHWVEQDMADTAPERVKHIPPPAMAYGVPMAGVRYYTYVPEQ